MIVTYHGVINVFYLHHLIWASCLVYVDSCLHGHPVTDSIWPSIAEERGEKESHSANLFLMFSLLPAVSWTLCLEIRVVTDYAITDSTNYDWQLMTNVLHARHIPTSCMQCVLRFLFYKKGAQAWGVTYPKIQSKEMAEPVLMLVHSTCIPFSHSNVFLGQEDPLIRGQQRERRRERERERNRFYN